MRQIEKLGNLYKKTHQIGMVYSTNGICPVLCGGQRGWIYSVDGYIGTLPASQYKNPAKIVIEQKPRKEINLILKR